MNRYHNMKQEGFSFLVDHSCTKVSIPTRVLCTLSKHSDEVWIVKFSPNGRLLCTVSKDALVVVWEVRRDNAELFVNALHEIKAHNKEVNSLAWSSDSRRFLTSSRDSTIKLWDVETGQSTL